MESRRNFVKAAFTFGTAVFASAKALAAQHTGHDKAAEHNMHMATDSGRHKGRVSNPVLVESPDVPQLPWRMDGNVKEFHLVAEPVKQELVPGKDSEPLGVQWQRSRANDSGKSGRPGADRRG